MTFHPWFEDRKFARDLERLQQHERRRAPHRKAASSLRSKIESLEDRCLLSTFTVLNINDSGPDSLRQAMLDANTAGGGSTIVFDIPGTGVQRIAPLYELPALTASVTIDGYTQPGSSPNSLRDGDNAVLGIELDGTNASSNGLTISAGETTIRGLDLHGWGLPFTPAAILITTSGGDTIEGNFIGTDASGSTAVGNNGSGVWVQSAGNVIGGTDPAARNVISGNHGSGIFLDGGSNNLVEGNFIGTDVTSTHVLPNHGTPADSSFPGIKVSSSNNTIGGTASGARNVISGNSSDVVILGLYEPAMNNIVQGNFIGTDATGSAEPTGALGEGLWIIDSTDNTIGGTTAAARNVISTGGDGEGLIIEDVRPGVSTGNVVQGNYVGTDVTGNFALGNYIGIDLDSGYNTIGGTTPGAGNVISGTVNLSPGIDFDGGAGDVIEGNFIGTNEDGTVALPNSGAGIMLEGAASSTAETIGGTASGSGNVIAFNGGGGVVIANGYTGVAILGNSIFGNTGLGIDLGRDGLTPNTPGGPHLGANDFQNFPVMTSLAPTAAGTEVIGTLDSTPDTAFTVQFFGNPAAAAGYAQGESFLAQITDLTTDDAGNASFDIFLPASVQAYPVITATATDPEGDTSEFSVVDTTTTLTASAGTVSVGQPVTLTALVSSSGQALATGNVIFTVDGVDQVPAALAVVNGQDVATLTLDALTTGSHVATAAYVGDFSFIASVSSPVDVTIGAQVGAAPTSTALTASASSASLGQPVTFTAIIASPGQALPTGNVAFTLDGVAQPPAALAVVNGQDVATLTLSTLTAGDHVVAATYDGDASFAASSSDPVDVTISASSLTPTTTILTASPTSADFGQPVTFTAIVASSGQAQATGNVTFTVDGVAQPPAALSIVNGQDAATLTLDALTTGNHIITAAYDGDSSFVTSTSDSSDPVNVTINAPALTPTATALSTSPSPFQSGQPVVLTAIVTATGGSPATGSVIFTVDGVAQPASGLSVINGRDVATLTLNSLVKGNHVVTAAYGGSAAFAASLSGPASVLVTAAAVSPDGPVVMKFQRFGYHSQPTLLVLTFSEDLDLATAGNAANYRIARVDPHGKFGRPIAIRRITYSPADRTVTLHPSQRLNVHKRFELIVDGTSRHAVVDLALHALDGGNTGRTGSDYHGAIDWAATAGPSLPGKRYAKAWRKLVASGAVGQSIPAK